MTTLSRRGGWSARRAGDGCEGVLAVAGGRVVAAEREGAGDEGAMVRQALRRRAGRGWRHIARGVRGHLRSGAGRTG